MRTTRKIKSRQGYTRQVVSPAVHTVHMPIPPTVKQRLRALMAKGAVFTIENPVEQKLR